MGALLLMPSRVLGQNGALPQTGGSMGSLDLGVNSDAIKYEVALEILGQERQPFMAALRAEREKASPSEPMIRYYEQRLAALDELQDTLRVEDTDSVNQICDPKNGLIRS